MKNFAQVIFLAALVMGTALGARSEERFFPPGVWGALVGQGAQRSQAEQEQSYEDYYRGKLREEHERPLGVARAAAHAVFVLRMSVYRRAIIPDFWMIRVMKSPGGRKTYFLRDYKLTGVGESSAATRADGTKLVRRFGAVDPAETAMVKDPIAEIAPLTGKTPSQIDDGGGMDGDTTPFEFSGGGKLNVIKRWGLDPKKEKALGQLEALLSKIAFD